MDLHSGDQVADLGKWFAAWTPFAAIKAGSEGSVSGVDMTDEQLANANRPRDERGPSTVTFVNNGTVEMPFPDASFDCVVSNGVINLLTR